MIKHDKVGCLVKRPVDMDCSLVVTLQMCAKTTDRATLGEEFVVVHTAKHVQGVGRRDKNIRCRHWLWLS